MLASLSVATVAVAVAEAVGAAAVAADEVASLVDAAALVVEVEVVAVDPTTTALQINIAPSPIVETSVDVDERVGRHGLYEWVFTARPRAQMNSSTGVRPPMRKQQSSNTRARGLGSALLSLS